MCNRFGYVLSIHNRAYVVNGFMLIFLVFFDNPTSTPVRVVENSPKKKETLTRKRVSVTIGVVLDRLGYHKLALSIYIILHFFRFSVLINPEHSQQEQPRRG